MSNERAGARIHLVRHGQTEWSLAGRHTGRTDLALTATGEDQARSLAVPLGAIRFDRVLTSPRLRARQTCELAGLGAQAAIEPDLAEWDYGAYEGLRSPEIQQAAPGWSVFEDGAPQGETPADVTARADRLLNRLIEAGQSVALFTHGHFGTALIARWISLDIGQARHFWLDTATISVLRHHPSHPDTRILAALNLTAWGL